MTRRLRATVHVAGVVYGPGDVPDPEHAERITNPDAWEDDAVPPAATGVESPAATPPRPAKKAAAKAVQPAKE